MQLINCIAVLITATLISCQELTPPYFNLAVGRRITATATCGVGVSENELYCKLVGANTDKQDNPNINLIQGQVCDYCNTQHPDMSHPPEYAIDGTERWWQSPPLSRGMQYNAVNLTIDLGQEFHVAYVFIKMANSPRPGIWVLERSTDNGKTYKPWQYFADRESDCVHNFGEESVQSITKDDSVVCETKFSKVVPLEGGEIVVSLLNDRPNANNFSHSSVLQEWTKATNIRLHFIRTKTLLGHLMSVARQDPTVTRRYFYSVKDISVGGRCVCNGHADTCDITDPNDPYKLLCRCQHHTCGPQCESCCPGFVQKKWRRATYISQNECEPCNCFGHSNECVYDEEVDKQSQSIDIHGNYEGGGVCQNCRHNTQGINCNDCKPGYYRPSGRLLNDTNVCERCDCDFSFSTGSCAPITGKCECNEAYLAPDCDQCNLGYYGFPDCKPCDCNANGTSGDICEVGGGQCPCKENYDGVNCDKCKDGYYGLPECKPCKCDSVGSVDERCDIKSGQCECITNYGGRNCGRCAVGWFNYPNCEFCNCDFSGTTEAVCSNQTGECLCKEGYGGPRCDQCASTYFGFPTCTECGCYEKGSSDLICSSTGQCRCLNNFSGQLCDQCSPGFFNFPDCKRCGCDFTGSIGISCDEEGTCTCKNNFDGKNCSACKEGFYNYPLCEECNCNPAGVLATFGGCGSLSDGLLCECKERVTGRICNTCKPLYWNLRGNNPLGCDHCDCHQPGTIGGLKVCSSDDGQCMCKPNVVSRRCDTCRDGTYQLQAANLFGCQECICDVGGSVDMNCDKKTGQCVCRPRVTGQTCNQPLKLHYFPTLFQHRYELEEGYKPDGTAVRYSYDNNLFPDYSWKGYAVFSQLQNEVLVDIAIDKPSLYHVIIRYVNINERDAKGEVKLTPETSGEIAQTNSVVFPHSRNATLMRVNNPAGIPVPFVLNPGKWTASISADNALIDYIVLLPSAFYEATLLQESVNNPCSLSNSDEVCRRFKYPGLGRFTTVRGDTGYFGTAGSEAATQLFEEVDVIGPLDSGPMAWLNQNQTQLQLDINLESSGPHVYLIIYHSSSEAESNASATVEIELQSDKGVDRGQAVLYNCQYNMLCRQAVADIQARITPFDPQGNFVSVIINLNGTSDAVIHSVVAIPMDEWSEEYLVPKSACIQINGECKNETLYEVVPGSMKIEFESSEHRQATEELPEEIYDRDIKLVQLTKNDTVVDIRGTVPSEGDYVFIVHYYQQDDPTFNIDVLIQNGQFFEATMPVPFCPSSSGCRSVIKKKVDGDINFKILENFMLTLNSPSDKQLWVDYVMVVPSSDYNSIMLKEKYEDRAGKFLAECSQDNFRLSLDAPDYCKQSTFTLTTEYNNGALACECNIDGSLSFECDQFGGQCQCKPNVIGRKCSECQTGFHGFPECKPCDCPSTAICHHITGKCICPARVTGDKCDTCEPYTYGFDSIIGCEECNCNPVGVARGQLQCDLQTGKCPCKPNVVGRRCNACAAGYWAFPHCQLCECDSRGTTDDICDQENSRCHCKENVYGPSCNECKPGTFYLEERNPAGCTKCFCFGATDRCRSALMFRVQVLQYTGWNATAINMDSTTLNFVDDLNITMEVDGATLSAKLPPQMPEGTFFYVSAPEAYLGSRVTSYGGYLRYRVSYTMDESEPGGSVIGPDVILVGNNMTILHDHLEQPSGNDPYNPKVLVVESNFMHMSGSAVTRDQLMVLLSGLEAIYIRGLYYQPTEKIRISDIMLDVATKGPIADAPQALEVESCQCPQNYIGSSCEECAPGYYRSHAGPHLGFCVPCQCNGHADTCDVNTGKCIDCQHDTTGDHCDQCLSGYYGDATQGTIYDCMICVCPLPYPSNNFATSCEVFNSGKSISCQCKEGYFGPKCDVCSAGYFGRPDIIGGSCKPCECSGNINATNPGSCDSETGDCLLCMHHTAGTACNYCAQGYFGDAIVTKDCRSCSCDKCGTKECNNQVGSCQCQPNVIGTNCSECAPEHWGFKSCLGCRPCSCGVASYEKQCNFETGQCECKDGVTGLRCDICEPGYWNYGDSGCQPCNCDEVYSAGTMCDPLSGQCQCLPGVIGDKCDHCPWRWVLITGQGCQECGPCIHALLDETDSIANILEPALAELEGASTSYFAYKRLDNVNKTIRLMRPTVDEYINDPNKLDLTPLKDNVTSLESDGNGVSLQAEELKARTIDTATDADKTRMEALKTEKTLLEGIRTVYSIVQAIEKLAAGLETEDAISDVDKLIAEAERILLEIHYHNFTDTEAEVNTESLTAFEELDTVQQFLIPAFENKALAQELRIKLERLTTILADLKNETDGASGVISQVLEINSMNKKSKALTSMDEISGLFEATEKLLVESGKKNEESEQLLSTAIDSYSMLNTSVDMLNEKQSTLEVTIQTVADGMNATQDLVGLAESHSAQLSSQIIVLERLLEDTTDTSKLAVEAATAYQGIKAAILESVEAANGAINASMISQNMSLGATGKTSSSMNISKYLSTQAESYTTKVKGELSSSLVTAKASADSLSSTLTTSKNMINMLNNDLHEFSPDTRTTASAAIEASSSADEKAQAAFTLIKATVEKLPDKLQQSETIKTDIVDTNDGIKRAATLVERVIGTVPEMMRVKEKTVTIQKRVKTLNTDFGDRIAELRRKVALARDQTKRIEVGASFSGDTTIQLRNPEKLQQAATYTQMSFYFKTRQRDGMMTYIGNEVGSNKRIKRLTDDDFMAIQVREGKAQLIIDLGNGPVTLNNPKYIADDQWHQLIVERLGNTASITVKTENEEDQTASIRLIGTKIVFNLEQKESKFYVGGFPSTAKIQSIVTTSSFKGEIQKLEFGKNLLGFWNFVKASGFKDGSADRDKLVIIQKSTGLKFDGSGYSIIKTEPDQFKRQTDIFLNFKSYSPNALLLLITNSNDNFLAVELRDGLVLLKFNLGSGVITLTSNEKFNDGEWHNVEVSRVAQTAILKVNKREVDRQSGTGTETELDVSEKLYLAGFPGDHGIADVETKSFEGCIDEFYVSASLFDLNENVEALGAITGCPASVARTVSFEEGKPGYVAMPNVNIQEYLQLTFKFKTEQDNALLFYTTNIDQSSSLAISLADGAIVVRSRPGGEVQTPSNTKYNDLQWHYIMISKADDSITIGVDDFSFVEMKLSEMPIIDTTTPIYVGGVPADLDIKLSSAASIQPLVGCIGDTTVNGKFQNFAESLDKPNASLASCPLSGTSIIPKETTTSAPTTATVPQVTPAVTPGGPIVVTKIVTGIVTKIINVTAPPKVTKPEEPTTVEYVTTPVPTEPPVTVPTEPPTAVPTEPPTAVPTEPPTTVPTEPPTTIPTEPPTTAPTEPPTTVPTEKPPPQCGLPLIPFNDPDVKPEDGIRFGNKPNSRYEYDYVLESNIGGTTNFSLEFKTSAPNGLLFYVAGTKHVDIIALFLKDGKVHFYFNCGTGTGKLISNEVYNDSEWHTVVIYRKEIDGQMTIDDNEVIEGQSLGQAKWINIKATFFFGGLSENVANLPKVRRNFEGVTNSFNGCIRNIKQGASLLNQPSRKIDVSPCSDKVEDGSFFSANGGYIQLYDKFKVGISLDFTLDIKPRNLSGVILSVHRSEGDFLTLQLINGNVKFTVDNGAGSFSNTYYPPSEGYLCDGQWHRIQAVKAMNALTISVDGKFTEPSFGVPGISSTDTNDPLYLGGIPTSNTLPLGVETFSQFVGCVAIVEFNSKAEDLSKAKVFGDATLNTCPTI